MVVTLTKCCRYWWIVWGSPWGRCGLCGVKPVMVDPPLFEDSRRE